MRPTCRTNTRCAPSSTARAERDAVHEAAVEVVILADPDRGEQAGHCGGGEDGVDDRPAVEPVLGGVLDPGGAALERHRQVLDAPVVELRDQRPAQRFRGVHGGAGARQLAQPGDGAGGEDLGGVRRAPQALQTVGDLSRRAGGEHRAVDRADAGADDEIGADARVEKRAQHADLHRAEHSPAAEHDGGADAFRGHRPMLARLEGRPGDRGAVAGGLGEAGCAEQRVHPRRSARTSRRVTCSPSSSRKPAPSSSARSFAQRPRRRRRAAAARPSPTAPCAACPRRAGTARGRRRRSGRRRPRARGRPCGRRC